MARSKSNRTKPKKEPKKKGRRGWTTEAQEQFLMDHIPAYLASQGSKSRSDFWPPLWEQYFENWPVANISDDNNAEHQDGQVETADDNQADDEANKNKPLTLAQCKKVRLL